VTGDYSQNMSKIMQSHFAVLAIVYYEIFKIPFIKGTHFFFLSFNMYPYTLESIKLLTYPEFVDAYGYEIGVIKLNLK
jgi:hypothetical protein